MLALIHEKMSLDDKREIGVVLGTGGGAHDFSDAQYHMYYAGKVKQISIFSIPSGTMGTMSSEVSMRFGFRGMSHVVTSGCTSSTDAHRLRHAPAPARHAAHDACRRRGFASAPGASSRALPSCAS